MSHELAVQQVLATVETAIDALQTPVSLGALTLRNRVIMSPMSRLRADADLRPPEFVADYYAQRAGLV